MTSAPSCTSSSSSVSLSLCNVTQSVFIVSFIEWSWKQPASNEQSSLVMDLSIQTGSINASLDQSLIAISSGVLPVSNIELALLSSSHLTLDNVHLTNRETIRPHPLAVYNLVFLVDWRSGLFVMCRCIHTRLGALDWSAAVFSSSNKKCYFLIGWQLGCTSAVRIDLAVKSCVPLPRLRSKPQPCHMWHRCLRRKSPSTSPG